jgi:hypothetical protein
MSAAGLPICRPPPRQTEVGACSSPPRPQRRKEDSHERFIYRVRFIQSQRYAIIRRALPHVPADRIVVAPDCGLKYLPRDVALGKMQAMVAGAAIVRKELSR